MAVELTYVLITPYTILKSRTGGVIARLLSRADLELVAAQIICPTQEFTEKYANSIFDTIGKKDLKSGAMLRDYVLHNFSPHALTGGRRVMMLIFKGDNACKKVYSIVGNFRLDAKTSDIRITGETVRDTYADLVYDEKGEIKYFEPAVLTPPNNDYAIAKLAMFAEFAESQPNLVEHMQYADTENIERTLTIIKPDNWRYPSSKPGNIIDIFSKTGLRIIGCKIYQMSINDALQFYAPVKDVLVQKLSPHIGEKSRDILEKELKIKIPKETETVLSNSVGKLYALDQFYQIIGFMSGKRPDEVSPDKYDEPGSVKCMILIYEGNNAVKKIREVLGPTDPNKAPSGTIRKEFGRDVMINTAHASDSAENAKREMAIVRMDKNNASEIIKSYLSQRSK